MEIDSRGSAAICAASSMASLSGSATDTLNESRAAVQRPHRDRHGVEQLARVARSDEPGQQPGQSQVTDADAELDEGSTELRIGRTDPDVGGRSQREPCTDGVTSYSGDDRLRYLAHREDGAVDAASQVPVRGGHAFALAVAQWCGEIQLPH